ncbi:MAG: hypothetical protein CM15mP83_4120 [Flavobacteriaceae bacterium]|nr:MAG: hypothetical protein CM15mP83_4120 [Flavobacteriaceae bacterium]
MGKPHQGRLFFGDLEKLFDKLNGKELSYNNLLDIDAALSLMEAHESTDPTLQFSNTTTLVVLPLENTQRSLYSSTCWRSDFCIWWYFNCKPPY